AMFEEAATLHYPRALGLPDGMLPGDYVAPPQRPPVSAAAPQPAAEPPRGLVIPLSGPDGNLNIHVTVDQRAPERAPEPSRASSAALLLTLLCGALVAGTGVLIYDLDTLIERAGIPATALYVLPTAT